jgi:4-amino-4-deoxy-L-arabinose transferase-like glycosyltransferase
MRVSGAQSTDRMQAETGTSERPTTLAPMRPWHWVLLAMTACCSTFLNLYRLGQNGYGSHYYAAAVKSMLMSWHNLFFVAFDPAGFESVDKPPLGFWIQALSAKLLGFSGMSLLLPQALMGTLSVVSLFFLVRRSFGPGAGLGAAAMMAMTPIVVATSRSNHLDVALTLTLVLAAWAGLVAAESGRLVWLLTSAAIVGIGFNVKMLEAYLVVPALGVTYLVTSPIPLVRRARHLGCAALLLAGVSVSWALVVDLTPANRRPYIDSTEDNSELVLAFGYNGVNRLLYAGAQAPTRPPPRPDGASREASPVPAAPQSGAPFTKEIGPRGLLRLFGLPLGPQIGWCLPFSILGLLVLVLRDPRGRSFDAARRGWLLFGVWLLTTLVLFSSATFFHAYYLVTMAPPIAALSSAGLDVLFRDSVARPARDPRAWGLPLSIVLSAIYECHLLSHYPGWSRWMSPWILGLAGATVVALLFTRLFAARRKTLSRLGAAFGTGVGAAALLLPTVVWSLGCLTYGANSDSPSGGPGAESYRASLRQRATETAGPFRLASTDEHLRSYLETNRGNATYLVGSLFSNRITAPLILATGQPVMSLGGYRGTTPILTVTKLEEYIKAGSIRFFHLPFAIRRQRDDDGDEEQLTPLEGKNVALVRWIQASCERVPVEDWESGSWVTKEAGAEGPTRVFRLTVQTRHIGNVAVRDQLFDCGGLSR